MNIHHPGQLPTHTFRPRHIQLDLIPIHSLDFHLALLHLSLKFISRVRKVHEFIHFYMLLINLLQNTIHGLHVNRLGRNPLRGVGAEADCIESFLQIRMSSRVVREVKTGVAETALWGWSGGHGWYIRLD